MGDDELRQFTAPGVDGMREVAADPHSAPDLLYHLFFQEDHRTKILVLRNPNCPPEILGKTLDMGVDWDTRGIVLSNPNFPLTVLEEKIFSSDGRDAFYGLLGNPAVSADFLLHIVRRAETLHRDNKLKAPQHYLNIIEVALQAKNCPAEITAEYLVPHPLHEETVPYRLVEVYWRAMAQNLSITRNTFDVLWRDGSSDVRELLSQNQSVPSDWYIVATPRTKDMGALVVLAYRLTGADRDVVIARLARSKQVRAQKAVAELSSDPALLTRLCYSNSIAVRRLAFRNPAARDEDRTAAALVGV